MNLSLTLRALLAVLLMIGFYALALGMIAGLLYIPYMDVVVWHRFDLRIVLFCLIGAAAVAIAIVPRRDLFSPPGPLLFPAEHPRLFRELRQIASLTGQPLPAEVYLVTDVNAFVTRRGGLMGLGSRPVMGIGLPLLQALTVPEFRAVLAHEFGHFCGGDTRLGPWIYKTRASVIRTVRMTAGHHVIISLPFYGYALLFLRTTLAISRAQERGADRLAAKVAGAGPLMRGLKKINAAALAFPAYLNDCFVPQLDAGRRPPLAAGFGQFLAAPAVAESLRAAELETRKAGTSGAYDSHPPLRERLADLARSVLPEKNVDETRAIGLLDQLGELELALLPMQIGGRNTNQFKVVGWLEAMELRNRPRWSTQAGRYGSLLAGLTPVALGRAAKEPVALAKAMARQDKADFQPQTAAARSGELLGTALLMALEKEDWKISAWPGQNGQAEKNGEMIDPYGVVQRLAQGTLADEEWRARCESLGIARLDLGGMAPRLSI